MSCFAKLCFFRKHNQTYHFNFQVFHFQLSSLQIHFWKKKKRVKNFVKSYQNHLKRGRPCKMFGCMNMYAGLFEESFFRDIWRVILKKYLTKMFDTFTSIDKQSNTSNKHYMCTLHDNKTNENVSVASGKGSKAPCYFHSLLSLLPLPYPPLLPFLLGRVLFASLVWSQPDKLQEGKTHSRPTDLLLS